MNDDTAQIYADELQDVIKKIDTIRNLLIVVTMPGQAKSLILERIDYINMDLNRMRKEMKGVFTNE